jgi:peptidoglycan/LPS O-acetylase OafA/YrhL
LGFYLLAGGALLLRRKICSSGVIAVCGLALCLWPLTGWNLRPAYVLGLWPDFFCGALVWWAARRRAAGPRWSAAAALVALLVLEAAWPGGYGGLARVVAVGTAVALWIFSLRERDAPPHGIMRAFGWVGAFSYSLYLIHLAVLSPFMNLAQRFISPAQSSFCFVWLLAIGCAGTAGWLLYHWVEAPIEQWRKSRWSARRA